MDEYIERRKIYAAVNELLCDDGDHILSSFECGNDFAINGALDIIGKAPTADVRPERHGRWVSWEEAGNFIPSPDRYECSICHDAAERLCNGFDLLSSYCPNCGAKMDGKDGEDNG